MIDFLQATYERLKLWPILFANIPSISKADLLEHPFFGMDSGQRISVADEMEQLRGNRYKDE